MPDPSTHAKLVAAAAPAAAAAAGQTFGLDIWPLLWAATGGGLALIYIDPPLSPWRAVLSITGSTVLGGTLGQFAAVPLLWVLVHFFEFLTPLEGSLVPLMAATLALLLGLFAQSTVPQLLKRAGERAEHV